VLVPGLHYGQFSRLGASSWWRICTCWLVCVDCSFWLIPHSCCTPRSVTLAPTCRRPTPTLIPAGDAEIEEAVASRLYRAELAAAEAQTKLGEW